MQQINIEYIQVLALMSMNLKVDKIDLDKLVQNAKQQYVCSSNFIEKRGWTRVIFKNKDPYSSVQIFPNGQVQILGLKNKEQAYIEANKYFQIITQALMNEKDGTSIADLPFNFTIFNIIAKFNLGFRINLIRIDQDEKELAGALSEAYFAVGKKGKLKGKQIFHFLYYKFKHADQNSNVTARMSCSGKVQILGSKCENQIQNYAQFLQQTLQKYRIQ